MAKQSGIIQLEGTIDNITFHKSQDGYIAKKKGGVSGSRIATDPAFQRTTYQKSIPPAICTYAGNTFTNRFYKCIDRDFGIFNQFEI
jgi:hypothetical protein